jgi:hypothetical protein
MLITDGEPISLRISVKAASKPDASAGGYRLAFARQCHRSIT